MGDPSLDNAELIQRFLAQQSDYEQLLTEVVYSLKKLLAGAGLKVAAITGRLKTLESFLEKTARKAYSDPFQSTPDFAGTRVVCYYPDEFNKIDHIIESAFLVVLKEDKAQGEDRFGYNAIHLLVKLDQDAKGARYDV